MRGTLEVMNQAGDYICPEKVVPRVADSCSSLTKIRLDQVVYTEIMYSKLKLTLYQTEVKTLPDTKWGRCVASTYRWAGGWNMMKHIPPPLLGSRAP